LCGNTQKEIKNQISYYKQPVFSCTSCSLISTGDGSIDTKKFYASQYWDERNTNLTPDYTDVDSQGKYRNWLSQYKFCKKLENKKTILEIGGGQGQASFWFEKYGFNVTVLEPHKRNTELYKLKGKIINAFIEDFDTKEKFDVLWMSHVLEHIERPDVFLQKAKKWINKGGIFFIEVPNCEHAETLSASISEPHLWHFTKHTLGKLLQKFNYNIERVGIFRPATTLEGMLNKVKPFKYYPRIQTTEKLGRDLRFIVN